MHVSVGDATRHPFRVVVETPRGPNTVAIRKNGGHDFPLAASVGAESVDRVPSNSTARCTLSFNGDVSARECPAPSA